MAYGVEQHTGLNHKKSLWCVSVDTNTCQKRVSYTWAGYCGIVDQKSVTQVHSN